MNKKLLDRARQKLRVVDVHGSETGAIVERAKAHVNPGVKHLAFIVFVVNGKGELVLHKRHAGKVGGNLLDSPVSHVLADETLEQAVHRCLQHEYGIGEKLAIAKHGGFSYEKDYGDGTCENEYCLVLSVEYSSAIKPNPAEIEGKPVLMPAAKAIAESKKRPKKFEVWFNLAVPFFERSTATKRFL